MNFRVICLLSLAENMWLLLRPTCVGVEVEDWRLPSGVCKQVGTSLLTGNPSIDTKLLSDSNSVICTVYHLGWNMRQIWRKGICFLYWTPFPPRRVIIFALHDKVNSFIFEAHPATLQLIESNCSSVDSHNWLMVQLLPAEWENLWAQVWSNCGNQAWVCHSRTTTLPIVIEPWKGPAKKRHQGSPCECFPCALRCSSFANCVITRPLILLKYTTTVALSDFRNT